MVCTAAVELNKYIPRTASSVGARALVKSCTVLFVTVFMPLYDEVIPSILPNVPVPALVNLETMFPEIIAEPLLPIPEMY